MKTFIKFLFVAFLAISIQTHSQEQVTGCIYGDCFNGFGQLTWEDGGVYTGYWENGNPKGLGMFHSPQIKMWGEFNGKKLVGFGGMCFLDNNETSVGEWKDGKRDGSFYVLDTKTNQWFGAKFQNDKFVSRTSSTGCMSGDCSDGFGNFQWGDGLRYNGEFQDGKRYNKGTFFWPDGTIYSGEIRYEQANGKGLYLFSNGLYFEGTVKEGLLSNGRMYYKPKENSVKFVEGDFHGPYMVKGKIVFKNGDVYDGDTKESIIPNGNGTMTYADGKVVTGNWINGVNK